AVALGVLKAPDVDMEKIYREVACEPVDASYTVSDKGAVTYIDEVIGKDFDLAAATVQVQNPADHWDIKLDLTYPDVTVKKLKAPTCPDLLSTMSTKYNAGNKNRSNNLELAAQYINGTVLQPGEVFSFNSTVGKRTAARGFKKAGVYTGEGLDEDFGGGICQTSTTLYGACLYANLEIVERKNHMYTVSYWKMAGTDATVSWGSCDYKFKNSKEYPIKIVFECHNGTITCKIYGTEDGYTAYIKNEVYNYTKYETIHKPKDGSKSNSHGANGMTVQTYRYICKNGEVVEKVKEAKSVYRPLNAIVYDGDSGSSSTSKTTTTTKSTSKTTGKTTTTTTKTTTTTTKAENPEG
ncbi:MAG: VanW family protein, partial [Clostridia bacterium]|nr:VanW family protein [Clostridia bacterium]